MNMKMSEAMVACLRFLQDNPGVTYDKVPFHGATLNALARHGYIRHTLMMPVLEKKGREWRA